MDVFQDFDGHFGDRRISAYFFVHPDAGGEREHKHLDSSPTRIIDFSHKKTSFKKLVLILKK